MPEPHASPIADPVRAFMLEHLRSFEELETLLLVRSTPAEAWSPEAVAAKLNIAPGVADASLARLYQRGLLASRMQAGITVYRYEVSDAALAAVVDQFARAHEENRIAVLKQMSENAVERVRESAVSTFADAFLLGRKRDG